MSTVVPLFPPKGGLRYAETVSRAERAWEDSRVDYLKSWGWKSTCNTPGSYWLWYHDEIPKIGKTYCSLETAIQLTRGLFGLEGEFFNSIEDID